MNYTVSMSEVTYVVLYKIGGKLLWKKWGARAF